MSTELMHRLCTTLEKMESLYARVLPLLDLERKSLVEMNFELLFEQLKEKDELLALIRSMDKERLKILDHFAVINGVAQEELTLKTFAEQLMEGSAADKELGMRMMDIRSRIQDLIQDTQIKIKNNEQFIEKSVNNIRGLAATVTESVQTGREKSGQTEKSYSTYGKNAKVKKSKQKSGAIVSGHV